MNKILLSILLTGLVKIMSAQPDTAPVQDVDLDGDNQIMLENALDATDDANAAFSYDTQFENLEDLKADPLELNTVNTETLGKMGILSSVQIEALEQYRWKHGNLASIYELKSIPSWDIETIKKVLPYVYVSAETVIPERKFNLMKAFKYSKKNVFVRWQRVIEDQKGYNLPASTANRYLGSPDRFYVRARMSYKDKMSLGLTMEKDAGEQFFAGNNTKGFDFYSAHFFLKDVNKTVKSVAVGDFVASLGQGLISWGYFGSRKGAMTTNVRRIQPTLRPYTSVNESAFMRGAGVTLAWGKTEFTAFGSYKNRDANVVNPGDTLTDTELIVSSLQEVGYHRTPNEVADRNALTELTTGGRLSHRGKFFQIGLNGIYSKLSSSLFKDNIPQNLYVFQGNSIFNASTDYALMWRGLQFFGETALAQNGSVSTQNGFLYNVADKVDLAVVYRRYDKRYTSLYGNPFGETNAGQNEEGLYVGLGMDLMRKVRLSAYIDAYRFPWLRFNVDAPSRGQEFFAKLDWNPTRRISTYLQVRHETKERNLVNNDGKLDYLVETSRTSARVHMVTRLSREWELRNRLEMSFYDQNQSSMGIMFYQDLVWKSQKLPMTIQARLAIFDTQDFNTRIYAYENDVLYNFSIPAYYGKGMRFYINAHWDISRKVSIWLRYANFFYSDKNVISSGLEEIQGNNKSDFRVQMRFAF